MKVVAIIQARMGSQRFPGKVLAELDGTPMIDHVIARAQAIDGVDEVVLNIPTGVENDALAHGRPCPVYRVRDQEVDVLLSYIEVATATRANVIMRLTGDCPLLAPDLSGEVLQLFKDQAPDYCANIQPHTTWADGWDTEVFSYKALQTARIGSDSRWARQHVTVMMRQLCACLYGPPAELDLTGLKWSVDSRRDLVRVQTVLDVLRHQRFGLGWRDTLSAYNIAYTADPQGVA